MGMGMGTAVQIGRCCLHQVPWGQSRAPCASVRTQKERYSRRWLLLALLQAWSQCTEACKHVSTWEMSTAEQGYISSSLNFCPVADTKVAPIPLLTRSSSYALEQPSEQLKGTEWKLRTDHGPGP